MHSTAEPLEFSRVVELEALHGQRTEIALEATESENAALARRFGVDGIADFKASVVLTPFASGNKVTMKATFGADVRQTCVVTLEPLTTAVAGSFVTEFVPEAFIEPVDDAAFDLGDDDPPEPIIDGRLEIGELIAQHLGLEIDPFPRAPGAEFPGLELAGGGAAAARPSPFAVLEKLKPSKG
jgi:uncharacterized metal-binding protein YceD (DUF177 family)